MNNRNVCLTIHTNSTLDTGSVRDNLLKVLPTLIIYQVQFTNINFDNLDGILMIYDFIPSGLCPLMKTYGNAVDIFSVFNFYCPSEYYLRNLTI